LRESIAWDPVPSAYFSGLAKVLYLRGQNSPEQERQTLNQEALEFQKEALSREPGNETLVRQIETMSGSLTAPKP
jgi:hypothetical protein